jgi:hypothetical protein
MMANDFFSMLALYPYQGTELPWHIYLLWLSFLIITHNFGLVHFSAANYDFEKRLNY